MKQRNNNAAWSSLGGSVFIGVFAGVICQLILASVSATLLLSGSMSIDTMDVTAFITRMIAAFVSALLAGRIAASGKGIACISAGVTTILLWVIGTVLILDDPGKDLLWGIVSGIGACFGASLLILNKKGRKKNGYKMKHYR